MPKTIKEAMEFSEQDLNDFDMPEETMEQPIMDEPIPAEEPMPIANNEEMTNNGMNVVDDIRKLALKTMANLADNPEDPAYVILKKVWQMCDKKPEDQNKSSME